MKAQASAKAALPSRRPGPGGVPPSSARWNSPQPVDEDDGYAVPDPEEGFIRLGGNHRQVVSAAPRESGD